MRQPTINISDYYYQALLEYFKHIPEAALVNETSFVLDKEMIEVLETRSAAPLETYISKEESNKKLKSILGV